MYVGVCVCACSGGESACLSACVYVQQRHTGCVQAGQGMINQSLFMFPAKMFLFFLDRVPIWAVGTHKAH